MKNFLVLSTLVCMTVARPDVLHNSQLPNVQTYSSSAPQQLSLIRNPTSGVNLNRRVYNTVEANLENDESEDTQRRRQSELINQNARNNLGFLPFLPTGTGTTSSSVSSLPFDSKILNTLKVQSPYQQQAAHGVNSQLSATRGAQPFPSFIPTGGYSNYRLQQYETPEFNPIAFQQQQSTVNPYQNQLSPLPFQSNGLQTFYGFDKSYVTEPYLIL